MSLIDDDEMQNRMSGTSTMSALDQVKNTK